MGLVTCDIATSVNGYVTGTDQRLDHPFGDGIDEDVLHGWMFAEPDDHAQEIAGILDAGAFIMGRNMFSPGRGEWDPDWTGWWGEEPPYRAPVFVLTHHARAPLTLGETTFHFVTDGAEAALDLARAAANERNVAIAGGAATINQYLKLDAIDELRLHVTPMIVDTGERLMDAVGWHRVSLVSARATPSVVHLTYRFDRSEPTN